MNIKRAWSFLTVFTLLVASVPGMAETKYVTLAELYEQTRDGWHASYPTPAGKTDPVVPEGYTVEVNVEIQVPNVEKCPIVALEINKDVLADGTVHQSRVQPNRNDGFLESNTYFNYDAQTFEEAGLWFLASEFPGQMNARAEDSPMSPEDAEAFFRSLMRKYFGVENVHVRGLIGHERTPRAGADTDLYKPLDHGMYTLLAHQSYMGVPLLLNGKNMERYFPQCYAEGFVYDEQLYCVWGATLTQTEVFLEDVPLLPWSEIQKVYEDQFLKQGTLLDVYSVEFGYQLVLLEKGANNSAGYEGDLKTFPKGTFDRTYHVRPVWVLRGYEPRRDDAYHGANGEIFGYSPEDVPASKRLGVLGADGNFPIVIDAQTGNVAYCYAQMTYSDSIEPTILTWMDVP